MDTFIARQPIFDDNRRVFGYELLCRTGPENVFGGIDPDEATTKVIADSSFVFGLDGLTRGRLAFVNLTREALLTDLLDMLPASRTVAEILETVEPDAEVVAACRRLKERGFLLALDDVTDPGQFGELSRLADIVTVSCIGEDKPFELVFQAVTRARFEELIAPLAGLGDRAEELFLMGLFSLIDALMDRPLDDILGELGLAEDVVAGLLGREDNALARVHRCALAFERGDWKDLAAATAAAGIEESALPSRHLSALATARRLCSY